MFSMLRLPYEHKKKNVLIGSSPIRTLGMVRITGLEPAWVAPHEPESCASANSAISARLNYYIKCTFKIQ